MPTHFCKHLHTHTTYTIKLQKKPFSETNKKNNVINYNKKTNKTILV